MVSRRQALLGAAASALVLAEGLRAQSLAQRVAILGAAGAAAPAITTGVVAASRGQVPTAITSIANNLTSRRMYYSSAQAAISNLKTVMLGWYWSGGNETNSVAYTVKQYIEYPAGTFTQVRWAGATTVQVAAGGQAVSDATAVTIPPDTKFWVRTVHVSGSSLSLPVCVLPAGSTVIGVDDGNVSGDSGNSGTIPATTGVNTVGPAAVIGDIAIANARSFAVLGDSIADGFNDIVSCGVRGGSGWIGRGLDGVYPYFKAAKSGIRAFDVAASNSRLTALLNAVATSDAIVEYGINDLAQGKTQAELLASHQTIYGLLGARRIYQTTLTPRSDSTDAYATVANQTPKTDGQMSSLNSVNAAIRALPANVDAAIDAADAAMSAHDSDVWSAPPAATSDGTHPNSTKYAGMATIVAGAVG